MRDRFCRNRSEYEHGSLVEGVYLIDSLLTGVALNIYVKALSSHFLGIHRDAVNVLRG